MVLGLSKFSKEPGTKWVLHKQFLVARLLANHYELLSRVTHLQTLFPEWSKCGIVSTFISYLIMNNQIQNLFFHINLIFLNLLHFLHYPQTTGLFPIVSSIQVQLKLNLYMLRQYNKMGRRITANLMSAILTNTKN